MSGGSTSIFEVFQSFPWYFEPLPPGIPDQMNSFVPLTIVTGLPRSGTSMMMQVLNAGGRPAITDGNRAPDRHNPRGYYELLVIPQAIKAPQAIRWEQLSGCSLKVLYLILYSVPLGLFPFYLHGAHRDHEEVLSSQNTMLG